MIALIELLDPLTTALGDLLAGWCVSAAADDSFWSGSGGCCQLAME